MNNLTNLRPRLTCRSALLPLALLIPDHKKREYAHMVGDDLCRRAQCYNAISFVTESTINSFDMPFSRMLYSLMSQGEKSVNRTRSPILTSGLALMGLVIVVLMGLFVVLRIAEAAEPQATPSVTETPILESDASEAEPIAVAAVPLAQQVETDETSDASGQPPASNCLDCHSNAEQLQLLAEEPEEVESLSEGPG